MDALSTVSPSHLNVQRANGTSLCPRTSASTARSASILNNANNTHINNSTFHTNNSNTYNVTSAALSLDLLYKSTAPNAILNSGGRADEVRCYPGTREEVIGLVEKSITQEHSGPRMLWLSGPAGAGKTAIMQTVAERCEERDVPHANFFFFRADISRSNALPLVATLVHQIIQLYPSIAPAVETALESNPLIFQMGLHQQFDTLIQRTFATIQHSLPAVRPLALLIDGLDECDSANKTAQRQLLQELDTLLVQKGTYFRVVVASRVEPQISMAFKQLRCQVDAIFLDDQYFPENDIRLFVTAEFDKIKSTHYLAHTLGSDWPSGSDVDGVVTKSSGQFIYAATVMRFIAYSSASPILSLQKVQGLVPPAKNTPFAQLDAVYAYILEQADDLEAVKTIFAIKFLGQDRLENIRTIMETYQPKYSEAVFNSCLSELTPLDQIRAREYFVDLETFSTAAFPRWWASGYNLEIFGIFDAALNRVQQPTPAITAALMKPNPVSSGMADGSILFSPASRIENLVDNIHRIYAPHDPQSFVIIVRKWTSDNDRFTRFFRRHLSQSGTITSNSQGSVGIWGMLRAIFKPLARANGAQDSSK